MIHLEEDKHKCCGMLLQPPPGDLTGPYPALPYLKAYAEEKGHTITVRDLGIECLGFLTREDQVRNLLDRATGKRIKLESKKSLAPSEQSHYKLLARTAWIGAEPDMVSSALALFKDPGRFYNYRLYKQSCRVLDAFYGLLSAVHYPTVLTPSEYPTAQTLNSMERVLAHRHGDRNPYVQYYEEVLFPQVVGQSPKVIGISMEFGSQSVQALVLGYLLKETFPWIHITMGGAYLSQWVMLMGDKQLSALYDCTDSVICGEGEAAFSDLLERIDAGVSPLGIPNVMFRHPQTGEFHRLASLDYPDIEQLPPPDYSDLDLGAYLIPKPVIPYCVSRGCYWGKCVFCQNRYGENRMRRYQTVPVEKAIAEMSQLAERHSTNHFNFSNDVVDPPYLKRLSEALLAAQKRFLWNTDLRAEAAFTRDHCETMARAGLNSVAIGFESGCQKTLNAMNKGKKVETIRQVMQDLYGTGIATQAMGFLGFPGETEEEAETTVTFLEDNMDSLSYYVVGLLMVVPGSKMHEMPHEYGVSSISYEGNALMAPLPVWKSDTRLSVAAVNRLYHRLSHLEAFFAINEYPYVGALCTNHSFLYFETGPNVLKRLKAEENDRQLRLPRCLAVRDPHHRVKKLRSLVPRFVMPLVLYEALFPLDRIDTADDANSGNLRSFSGGNRDYVVGPAGMAIQLSRAEKKYLQAMDGKTDLLSLMNTYEGAGLDKLITLLMGLISHGLIEM